MRTYDFWVVGEDFREVVLNTVQNDGVDDALDNGYDKPSICSRLGGFGKRCAEEVSYSGRAGNGKGKGDLVCEGTSGGYDGLRSEMCSGEVAGQKGDDFKGKELGHDHQ